MKCLSLIVCSLGILADESLWVWHGKRNGWEDGLPFADALRGARRSG
jgi:hypothetical protein